jgi:4-amino-4-deoxy-L-arabinose transferase-like glycosyltransferase
VLVAYAVSRFSLPERFTAPFLLVISFAVAACFWRLPEITVDASRYFTQAKHLELKGVAYFFREWGGEIPAWTDLPLVPFLHGLIFRVFGESRVAIQIFTSFLFSMTAILTYHFGKTLWDEATGLLGGALLLGIPYLLTQAPLMLVDVSAMFFLTLSVFALNAVMKKGGAAAAALSVLSICFCILAKFSLWPMLSVLAVVFIVHRMQHPGPDPGVVTRRAIRVAALSLIIAAAFFLSRYDVIRGQLMLLAEFQGPGLKRWGESMISTFLFQIHPFISAAAAYSAYAALRKRDLRYVIIVWLPALAVLFQVRRIRYLIPLFPMLALMASYGLQEVRRAKVRNMIAGCAVAASLAVSLFAYLPFLEKMSASNLQHAGEFLDSIGGESVDVYVLPRAGDLINMAVSVPILDLFTKKEIHYEYEPRHFPLQSEIETSRLRFTWEYRNPQYYDRRPAGRADTIVVLSSRPDDALPPRVLLETRDYRRLKIFDTYEGLFSHRVTARVYW